MPQEPSRKLDGWKAIASYLGRDERTAQRWARERGMPVHRVPGGHGGAVFAFQGELDNWLVDRVGHQVHPGSAHKGSQNGPGTPEQVVPPAIPPTPVRDLAPAGPGNAALSRRPTYWPHWLIGFITIAAMAVTGRFVWKSTHQPSTISLVDLAGTSIIARDVSGQVLWRYALPPPTAGPPDSAGPAMQPALGPDPTFVDLDSNGEREVLVGVHWCPGGCAPKRSPVEADVLCLTASGDLLWTFRPAIGLTFGGRRFDGPWRIDSWLAPGVSSAHHVWLAIIHHTWWPSFLMSIDAAGRQELRYVSSGSIYALAATRVEGRTLILAAGVNNEYAAASLAVLDEQAAPATSPQTFSSSYWCDDCPAGRPLRFLVFPRSELNELSGTAYNRVEQITVTATHVEISVFEDNYRGAPLRSIYRLSRNLDVESISFSDAYWQAHRQLGRERKIFHTVQQCEEYTRGKEVRVWTPSLGWTTSWAKAQRGPQAQDTRTH